MTALRPRRVLAALALVTVVVGVHGCVVDALKAGFEAARAEAEAPVRIEVSYVRDMALEAPPAAGPKPPAARPPRVAAAAAAVDAASPAASAASDVELQPPSETALEAMPQVGQEAAEEAVPDADPEVSVPALAPDALPAPAPLAAAATAESGASTTDLSAPLASVAPTEPAPAPASAMAASDATTGAIEAFDWPVSTRLSYVLTGNYRGQVHGSAQVEWIKVGSRYQVHLDVTVGIPFAPLLVRRMSSEGEVTAQGLAPQRYDEFTKLAFRDPRRVAMHFDRDTVRLANGQRRDRWPGLQDTASQFVQFTWMFGLQPDLLRAGNAIVLPLALPRNVDRWTYDVQPEETLHTPFGALQAIALKPRRAPGEGGAMTAEIWFAPQLRHLPVRIRIHQDAETYVDLMLSKRPELAAR